MSKSTYLQAVMTVNLCVFGGGDLVSWCEQIAGRDAEVECAMRVVGSGLLPGQIQDFSNQQQ